MRISNMPILKFLSKKWLKKTWCQRIRLCQIPQIPKMSLQMSLCGANEIQIESTLLIIQFPQRNLRSARNNWNAWMNRVICLLLDSGEEIKCLMTSIVTITFTSQIWRNSESNQNTYSKERVTTFTCSSEIKKNSWK